MAKVIAIKKNYKDEIKDIAITTQDYGDIIKNNPLAEKAYDRLMIISRKEKDYKNELRVINAGIKAFENFYRSKKSGSTKIKEISKKLNRSFGFADKKGNAIYEPEPIARWKKRRVTVENKLKNQS